MKEKFCVGLCPFCSGNGLLLAVKDIEKNEVYLSCDEAYHEFAKPQDVKEKKLLNSTRLNDVSIDLEEALALGWAEYIYIFKNEKWIKYTDRAKELL